MNTLQKTLTQEFPDLPWQFAYQLAAQTYFKVGGPAEAYVELADRQQIIALVKYCWKNEVSLTVLGGGSNVIISDAGIDGVVLKLTNDDFELVEKNDKQALVRVGAGIKTALLVRKTTDEGLTGLEFFLGVPGNIGGAVYNNAHYLEDLLSEHIHRVEVIDQQGVTSWLNNEECRFAYDYSRFQETKEIILQVEFKLAKGSAEESQHKIRQATVYRAETQPLGLPSSGCIFQNTPNNNRLRELFPQFAEKEYVPGGFLIDQAGLKGVKEGGIEVSDKHAAFFINTGQGKADDIQKLIDRVKSTVKEKFGVELQEEVFWLGRK
jgi:UDP-N-acetylmuramate dehydrogenase